MKENKATVSISSSQKIIGNTLFSTLSELSLLYSSVFFILAPKFLGGEVYGKFALALGFVGLFSLLIIFGFTYSITKIIVRAREKAEGLISNALYIQFALTLICFALCYGFAYIFKNKYHLEVRYLIIIVFVAESLKCYNLTLRTAFKAMDNFRYATIAVSIERAFLLIVGCAFLITHQSIFMIAAVLLVSRFIGFLFLVSFMYKAHIKVFIKPDIQTSRMIVKKSIVYVVQSSFGKLYDHIDVVMIGLFRTFEEVGWYSLGRRILEGLWFIPNIITEAVYPELSSRHLVSDQLVSKLFNRTFKYMLVISVVVSAGTMIIAPTLISFYGSDYVNATIVLILLGSAVIPSFLRYLFGTTLVAINLQKMVVWISAGRSLLNIVLNIILISQYGYVGATIATVATEYVSMIAYIVILYRRNLIRRSQLNFIYKAFIPGVMLIPVYFGMRFLHDIILFFTAIGIYVLLLFLFKIFEKDEIQLFRQYFRQKRLFMKRRNG